MKSILYIGNNLPSPPFNPSYIAVLGPKLESIGYRMYYSSSVRPTLLRLLDMIISVFRRASRTETVLIDTYSTNNFYYALIISQLCRILELDYIPILHGGLLKNRLTGNLILSKMIFDNAKFNVAPSNYMLQLFNDFSFNNTVHIPNFVDISKYPFKPRAFKRLNLLWVRSFSKIYNPELAIQIMRILKEHGHTVNLCMVGPDSDGSMEHVIRKAQEYGLNVKFTGKLSKKKWVSLSKDYDFFINTSNVDNTPVSVIEAMALGLLVISTNVAGMPYLIKNQEDGILVDPDNAQLFVESLESCLRQPQRCVELSNAARKKAESFAWEKVKNQWNNIL